MSKWVATDGSDLVQPHLGATLETLELKGPQQAGGSHGTSTALVRARKKVLGSVKGLLEHTSSTHPTQVQCKSKASPSPAQIRQYRTMQLYTKTLQSVLPSLRGTSLVGWLNAWHPLREVIPVVKLLATISGIPIAWNSHCSVAVSFVMQAKIICLSSDQRITLAEPYPVFHNLILEEWCECTWLIGT